MATPFKKQRDAATTFFDNTVERETPFDVQFIEFLGKALEPKFSENLNTSRTDVLLEEAALKQNRAARTILDLCSGQPLLLEKLMQEITEGRQEAREYYYIGCDKYAKEELFENMWNRLAARARSLNIRTVCVPADASDPAFVRNALRHYHEGSFDFIYFANALHEINPAKVPDLLYMLVELLSDNGVLVVLDPDAAWLLDAKRWEGLQDLGHLDIDWEAKAVWLPDNIYKEILISYGCTVESQFAQRRSQEFWILYVKRDVGFDTSKRQQLVDDAKRKIKDAISEQARDQDQRIRNSRIGLIDELTRSPVGDKKRIRNKGVEFLCLSTSQSRRVEAIIELNQS